MTGRPRKYPRGSKPTQVSADIELLEAAEKLGVNRSDVFNKALAKIIGKQTCSIERLKLEIDNIDRQILSLQTDKAVKVSVLKEKEARAKEELEEKQQREEELENKKLFCKVCGNKIQNQDTDYFRYQYCKNCWWNNGGVKSVLKGGG